MENEQAVNQRDIFYYKTPTKFSGCFSSIDIFDQSKKF